MVRIWYQNTVQNAAKPDSSGMFRLKEFSDPTSALIWSAQNKATIKIETITQGNVKLEAEVKNAGPSTQYNK